MIDGILDRFLRKTAEAIVHSTEFYQNSGLLSGWVNAEVASVEQQPAQAA